MPKFNKFIIPLALAKIVLAFLILQLFFSSCSADEDVLHTNDYYTKGPVFEIEAGFGGDEKGFAAGDTVYLEIEPGSKALFDELSGSNINLASPQFRTQFAIINTDNEFVYPDLHLVAGQIMEKNEGYHYASFEASKDSRAFLRIGFIFEQPGDYTFYFANIPNSFYEGGTDIYYDFNAEDKSNFKEAYAVYLFDLEGGRTLDYTADNNAKRKELLNSAGSDQAIKDFTIVK